MFTVVVPARPGTWHSPEFGPPAWDLVPATIIRVHTDAGISGLGEAMRGIPAPTVLAYASGLSGHDPLALNLQALPIGDFFDQATGIYEAYEMALYDIVGKVRGVPVYQLFGGAFRERVEASLCTGQMTPRDAAQKAREALDAGYRFLKMKATDTDPLVERIAAIHAEVGDALKIVVDPMRRFWRPAVLDEFCRRLEPFAGNLQCFEDPFDRGNLAGYHLMRQKTHFPLALHLYLPREVIEAVRAEACDFFNLMGSMNAFRQMAAIAEAAGAPVWHGSAVGFGISEAAILHVSAATKACTLSSDVVGEKIRQDDLIVSPIRFQDGFALVPQGPGLGVELDMDAVERFAVRP
jgi:muconate cycloisomerase